MIKKECYLAETILPLIGEGSKVILDGDEIKLSSVRLRTFKNSLSCVRCGLTGLYFRKEKHHVNDTKFHLNLYTIDSKGKEVLMTRDHILPKCFGGDDIISNAQTMCTRCNGKKSNSVPTDLLTQEIIKKKLLHDLRDSKGFGLIESMEAKKVLTPGSKKRILIDVVEYLMILVEENREKNEELENEMELQVSNL